MNKLKNIMGEFSKGISYRKLFWRFYLKTTFIHIEDMEGTVTDVKSRTIILK